MEVAEKENELQKRLVSINDAMSYRGLVKQLYNIDDMIINELVSIVNTLRKQEGDQ